MADSSSSTIDSASIAWTPTSTDNRQQPTTTTTTDNNRRQPTTTDDNRQQPKTTTTHLQALGFAAAVAGNEHPCHAPQKAKSQQRPTQSVTDATAWSQQMN
jgi:hypothetical protein